MKSDTEENIQYDYTYIHLKDRETKSIVMEVIMVVISGDLVQKGHRESFKVMKIFCLDLSGDYIGVYRCAYIAAISELDT